MQHPNDGLDAYNQLLDQCVAQEGASDADRTAVLQRAPPTSAIGACLYTCVMESLGVVCIFKYGCESKIRYKDVGLVARPI